LLIFHEIINDAIVQPILYDASGSDASYNLISIGAFFIIALITIVGINKLFIALKVDIDGKFILAEPIEKYATRRPASIRTDKLAVEALQILRDKNIDELPVVDPQGRVVGLLDVQDLLKAGLV